MADLLLLGAVSRALGQFSWRRVFLASSLCTLYAWIAAIRPVPLAAFPGQCAVMALAARIVSGPCPARRWGLTLLSVYAVALLCGGMGIPLHLRGPRAIPACLIPGAMMIGLVFSGRPPGDSWQVSMCLSMDGKLVRFPALIDTGNRLREPVSGLPVLIAETGLLKGALPESGYRILPFGGVGGSGRMVCFKPTMVWIEKNGRRLPGPPVWVGLYPGALPGQHQALAPPEIAYYVQSFTYRRN